MATPNPIHALMTATALIARSASHNEIVTAEYTVDVHTELALACEDWIEVSDTLQEYWGTDDDGREWRVHLTSDSIGAANREHMIALEASRW